MTNIENMAAIPTTSALSATTLIANGPRNLWASYSSGGATGPTGAAGPTGASGPTGPSGASAITVLQAETTGNVTYDATATRDAGVYQLQLSIETPVVGSQAILFYATNPPSTSVLNYSGAEVLPTSVGSNLLCLNSGFFTHAGGSLRVEISTAGTAWSGTWTLQLVKIA